MIYTVFMVQTNEGQILFSRLDEIILNVVGDRNNIKMILNDEEDWDMDLYLTNDKTMVMEEIGVLLDIKNRFIDDNNTLIELKEDFDSLEDIKMIDEDIIRISIWDKEYNVYIDYIK